MTPAETIVDLDDGTEVRLVLDDGREIVGHVGVNARWYPEKYGDGLPGYDPGGFEAVFHEAAGEETEDGIQPVKEYWLTADEIGPGEWEEPTLGDYLPVFDDDDPDEIVDVEPEVVGTVESVEVIG